LAALGVLFNVQASPGTPDLEKLILDTARLAGEEIPAFTLAVTWLANYGELVARHRLAKMIADELELVHQPAMGLLLESVIQHTPKLAHHFALALTQCARAREARPLMEMDRANAALRRLSAASASSISRKWGRWLEPIELKSDAIRPPEWIGRNHPILATRALVGGDLIATILAEASTRGGKFQSEVELAARCGASRPALRDALAKLRLAALVEQRRIGNRNMIQVHIDKLSVRR
jgi:hypothetical protein